MTPTKQDKELRDKVATIVEYWDFSPLQDEDSRIERLKNEIMQLITADRKRVALEARLNGKWEILSKIPDGTPVLENGKICGAYELRIKVNRKIAELKAQQEEV